MPLNRRSITLLAGAAVLLIFVVVTINIFRLRSGTGDLFAQYSTYRADPLGMMAFYSALQAAMPDATVDRYIQPFEEMPDGLGTTFIIAGATLGPDPVPVLERIEAFALRGGRVVIAFLPIRQEFYLNEFRSAMRRLSDEDDQDSDSTDSEDSSEETQSGEETENGQEAADETGPDESGEPAPGGDEATPARGSTPEPEDGEEVPENPDAEPDPDMEDISERWEFDYGFIDPGDGFVAKQVAEYPTLDESVAWRSGLYFEPQGERWQAIYTRIGPGEDNREVLLMERQMGSGSIVISSDSYFFSNEALRSDRASGLLQWMVGTNPTILFSEVHLGTQRQDRIMTLLRQYRLHGVLFGFALLGLLFVWRNATTLLPRRAQTSEDSARQASTLERSHQDGLDNLLARFIAQDQLTETCLREWLQHNQKSPRRQAVQSLYEALQNDPAREKGAQAAVAAYNKIARELQKR